MDLAEFALKLTGKSYCRNLIFDEVVERKVNINIFLKFIYKPLGIFCLLQNQSNRAYFYETIDHSGHVGRNRIKKFQVYVILELW